MRPVSMSSPIFRDQGPQTDLTLRTTFRGSFAEFASKPGPSLAPIDNQQARREDRPFSSTPYRSPLMTSPGPQFGFPITSPPACAQVASSCIAFCPSETGIKTSVADCGHLAYTAHNVSAQKRTALEQAPQAPVHSQHTVPGAPTQVLPFSPAFPPALSVIN
jgi:hypothetical protein